MFRNTKDYHQRVARCSDVGEIHAPLILTHTLTACTARCNRIRATRLNQFPSSTEPRCGYIPLSVCFCCVFLLSASTMCWLLHSEEENMNEFEYLQSQGSVNWFGKWSIHDFQLYTFLIFTLETRSESGPQGFIEQMIWCSLHNREKVRGMWASCKFLVEVIMSSSRRERERDRSQWIVLLMANDKHMEQRMQTDENPKRVINEWNGVTYWAECEEKWRWTEGMLNALIAL